MPFINVFKSKHYDKDMNNHTFQVAFNAFLSFFIIHHVDEDHMQNFFAKFMHNLLHFVNDITCLS